MVNPSRPVKLQRLRHAIAGRPRLSISAGIALAVGIFVFFTGFRPATAFLIGWNVGVVFFLVMLAQLMAIADSTEIRRHAAQQDVGQFVVLALTAAASAISLVAIYAEVSIANEAGAAAPWRLALAVLTIFLSWLFVQTIFAVHYAHEYYGPEQGELAGLAFPGGDEEPDYWDFLYFSLVIGMTSQVSDVAVTDRRLRRTVAAHGVVAFWFNVAVLALLINIAADAIRAN